MDISATYTFPLAMSPKPTRRGLGWAIRRVRQGQKRTLEDVAMAVGSDAGNISRIERGTQNAPEDLLQAIAAVLGLSMSDLWQIAEMGQAGVMGVAAKAGKMTDAQRAELERFADFLLTQDRPRA